MEALLRAIPLEVETVVLLDNRFQPKGNIPKNINIRYVMPTILDRIVAEWWLFKNSQSTDKVLFFGNLPPLFNLSGRTSVFIQNRYLIQKTSLTGVAVKAKIRITVERLWLSFRSSTVEKFVVQTSTMKRLLTETGYVDKQPIYICPFQETIGSHEVTEKIEKLSNENKQYDFIYVASGETHKNHRRLIEAWCLLAQKGVFPSLCLTLDDELFPEVCLYMNEQKQLYGLKLENVGSLTHSAVLQIYLDAKSLIYPSLMESFGLPLIEARQSGLSLVAAERDYVRDVVIPSQTFDPESAVSIARAVERHLGINESELELIPPSDFYRCVIEDEL